MRLSNFIIILQIVTINLPGTSRSYALSSSILADYFVMRQTCKYIIELFKTLGKFTIIKSAGATRNLHLHLRRNTQLVPICNFLTKFENNIDTSIVSDTNQLNKTINVYYQMKALRIDLTSTE